jgi:hypothetical protein
MNISPAYKNVIIATAVVAMVVVVFLVHALAGLSARPVVFADPPGFVEQYAAQMGHSDHSSPPKEPDTDGGHVDESEYAKLTAGFSQEEALVLKVIMDGDMDSESLDVLLRLFAHPERAQRVKIASAFAAVNYKYTHDEESGYPEKRGEFWVDAAEHLSNIRNALSEALITSTEEGTMNNIWYTLAWLPPEQDRETIELFAWAAKHHPNPGIRRFSVYYVVQYGGHEDLAGPLLGNRTHDPDYRVRKEVLNQRFRRFTEGVRLAN